MKNPGSHKLPTAVADTRSLMRELEQLSKRLKPSADRPSITVSAMVIKAK